MNSQEEWNEIIQEEVENMVCRLRERGIDADRFEVTVKGQRAEPIDNPDIVSVEGNDIEAILRDIQQKGKSKEKYIVCEKCGERILESQIKTYKNEKICNDCYSKIQPEQNIIQNLLNKGTITTSQELVLLLQLLLYAMQSQGKKGNTKKKKEKKDNENEKKD